VKTIGTCQHCLRSVIVETIDEVQADNSIKTIKFCGICLKLPMRMVDTTEGMLAVTIIHMLQNGAKDFDETDD
jgi:hypothetical protein